MTSSAGIEPEPHRWEASVLTVAPSQLLKEVPNVWIVFNIICPYFTEYIEVTTKCSPLPGLLTVQLLLSLCV